MKIKAWRITKKKYAKKAFAGEGAKTFGGRWNPPGHLAVYTADSLSLAILELIVHLDKDEDIRDFVAIPVEFDEVLVTTWPESELPRNWSQHPIPDQTQQLGKAWLEENQYLALKVPSSVVPNDSNYVINPLHPEFASLKIGKPQSLYIDPRLSDKIH
ncbi:MAG: RES family NAD+ phosphorylase [Desulfobacteraceae bacterium]|nr:RES family NAD+ phosphorylase [Desulfobacteraceae bacterium]